MLLFADVKEKSPYDPFFKDTRYFIVKSCNEENVILSKVKVKRLLSETSVFIFVMIINFQGVWATTPRNERLFNRAYRHHRNVILVFSVEKSQSFQGFLLLSSETCTYVVV